MYGAVRGSGRGWWSTGRLGVGWGVAGGVAESGVVGVQAVVVGGEGVVVVLEALVVVLQVE